MRHEKNERAFFERLGTISDRYEASPDFTEYSAVSNIGYGFIQQHDFPWVAIDENLQDVNQIQLYHGAPYLYIWGCGQTQLALIRLYSYIGLLIDINGVDDGQSCNIVLYVKAELRILLL